MVRSERGGTRLRCSSEIEQKVESWCPLLTFRPELVKLFSSLERTMRAGNR
jgi:hypothetical protein